MKKILFLLFLSFTFVITSKATHLMGGEITWKCIKSGADAGKYIFTVKAYRDCQGIPISTGMSLAVHNVPGLTSIPLIYIGANDISPSCNTVDGSNSAFSCNGTNVGYAGNGVGAVEEHSYQSQPIRINGIPDSNGWHFTWSSCCRNNAISNGLASDGFTLRAVMYSYTDSLGVVQPNNNNCYDSSPKFYEKPRTILEAGNGYDPLAFSNGFVYSHNAFDEERDSLRYDFAQPLSSGFYDFTNPSAIGLQISGNFPPYPSLSNSVPIPGVQMNNATGRTYYPADYVGNFVTCTRVEAWKCGYKVSEVYREIQVVISVPICNLGDTTGGNIGANTLCNTRPLVQPPFFFPLGSPQYQWDTIVHCGDTVSFDFLANDYDVYPNGSLQDLQFTVSGGQFMNYNVSPPILCDNPPCATFEELSTGVPPPFISTGGTGVGYFEWITSCNHVINNCGGDLQPSLYTFVINVQDDFCPAPAIENTAQVISIYVCPPCSQLKVNPTSSSAGCSVSDGTISIAPSGGFPPYNAYYFDMNGIPVNPNSVYAGNYQVRVVDSSQCESVDTVTVSGPPASLLSISAINVSCNGVNNGSASTVLAGVSPFTYLWSNGANTQAITSLSPGLYSVSVTDSNGCLLSDSILITEPDLLIIDSSVVNNTVCFGGNTGSINISVSGGTPLYSYLWSNGSILEDISSLTADSYSVLVTDDNQCSSNSYSFTITEPTQIQNIASVTPVLCFGGNDGSIDISVSGGTPSYSYLWGNGATTEYISSLISGSYSVTITDSNSCTTYDTVNVFEPLQITSSLTAGSSTLTGIVSGGSVPYSLTIYDPSNTFFASSTNNFGTSFTINPLVSGQYYMVTTDLNGCSDTVYALFFLTTDIDNIISDDIQIYPNPTKDRVTIDFNWNVSDLSISIYDMLGKSSYYQNQFYNLSSKEIILDDLQDGSYLIIMNVDGIMYHHPIIIQD